MTKIKRIKKRIEANKNINPDKTKYYSTDKFIDDGQEYIEITKKHGMYCIIDRVSASGMTRWMKFHGIVPTTRKQNSYLRNFTNLFEVLGYTFDKKFNVKVVGCGMDMVFNTNYNVIYALYNLGFCTKAECKELSQITPTCI